MTATASKDPIRIGVSSCLLGENVRFDGGHKKDDFITGALAAWVEFVPVCPEVEVGMGIPRPTIRLERRDGEVRLVDPKHGVDHTAAMRRWAEKRVADLEKRDLCGYVLKKDSPSCGMERVRVYAKGAPTKDGVGLFAEALRARLPLLPVEEEGRLHDDRLRENFVERVFAYRRLKDLFRGRFTVGDLVRFHTAEKLLLLAHHPEGYRQLGRIVAAAKGVPRAELAERYGTLFMESMARPATTGRQVNVLQHMAGYFSGDLSADERAELQEAIRDYGRRLVPLVVPLTLVRHHVRKLGVAWLAGQTHLEPHPRELMLRNHV
ncbi:MAG TPA: DUF523 and DUF1722 domain-containing protein [Anaeromyxobacteraceae bacterium]|nr:DUF523 and DUF1722 domain-containing protein [Anaeromyxobacteraceae bacterium]